MSLLFKTASSMNQEFKFHQLLYKPTAHISQFRQILGEFQCNGYTPTREFPWWLRWWWICLQCRAYINTVIRRMPAHVLFVSDCDPMDRTVVHRAPLSMGFSRQGYWSGLPCPPPGDLPDPGIEPESLTYPALAGGLFTTSATWEAK